MDILVDWIVGIALICIIVFLILMLRSKKKSIRRRRMMQIMIVSIVVTLVVPGLYDAINSNKHQGGNPVVVKNDNITTKTDKNGYYHYKIHSTARVKIKIQNNPYIIKKDNSGNSAQAIIKLPNNINITNIWYSASVNGEVDAQNSYPVYNNSDAYKRLQANNAKIAKEREAKENAKIDANIKKQEQKKQAQQAQYEAQYPPIEDKLSNPFKATEGQQSQAYLIRGKVIDMAAYPAGMQYITQDKNGNKYFTFLNKGKLRGGNRANLDDTLEVYAKSIFPTSINQYEIDNGMENSYTGEKVMSTLPDRVYLKREQ